MSTLRNLVAKWHSESRDDDAAVAQLRLERQDLPADFFNYRLDQARTRRKCADELLAALDAHGPPPGEAQRLLNAIGYGFDETLEACIRHLIEDFEKRGDLLDKATKRAREAVPGPAEAPALAAKPVPTAEEMWRSTTRPILYCCCAEHHQNHGCCLQCPIHGLAAPGASTGGD